MVPGLTGLALACTVGLGTTAQAQQIIGTNQVALTDFDSGGAWSYGYDYTWGGTAPANPNWAWDVACNDPLIDPTNGPLVMAFYFTNAPYQSLTLGGGGYGIGTGGPMRGYSDPSTLASSNLSDYIFEFDARVEGLAEGQTAGYGQMQLQWYSSGANAFQCNFNVNLHSNWTHYAYLVSDADGYGVSTVSNWVYLVQNFLIGGLQFNMNLNQPDPQFGFDDNNALFIDNVKLSVIVRQGPVPPTPPTVPFTILDWNMDDKPMWGGWGPYGWSANSYQPIFTWSPAAPGYGVGGSNAWIMTMDNTLLAPPNTPAWAGGGSGDNGPTDYTLFNTGDLTAYSLSFDARAQGLNPAKLDPVTCNMQFFMDAPGGNMRADFQIVPASNWVHNIYTLNQGVFGIGSKTMFTTNYNVTAVRIQVQIEDAASEADWSFDNDNVLIVDNIKFERLYIGCPPLSITQVGSNIVVTWAEPSTGTSKLQSATSLNGTWNDVPGAASGYTIPVASAPKFFRTQWIPPAP